MNPLPPPGSGSGAGAPRALRLPGCPAPPGWALDWRRVEAGCPWLAALRGCPQHAAYHGEGDVAVHTRLVVEALVADERWRALDEDARQVLFAAALLHDVGKPLTTHREPDGRVVSPRHAPRGAAHARQLLLERGDVPCRTREAVVALVRLHALPTKLLERPEPVRLAVRASLVTRCDQLALLAEADVRGRIAPDRRALLEQVELFREQCRELGCLGAPYPFSSDHTRFTYFRGVGRDPATPVHDDRRLEVLLLAGLPGAGKDAWVAAHGRGWPVVSLDALRQEQGRAPTGGQAGVVHAAKDRARALLRAGRSFVWNATNVTARVRGGLIGLFADYAARVRIVYLEPPFAELLRRNHARSAAVPERAIRELLGKLDLPDLTEAHAVDYVWD